MEESFTPDGIPVKPSQTGRAGATDNVFSVAMPRRVQNRHASTSKEHIASHTPPGTPPLVLVDVSSKNPQVPQASSFPNLTPSIVRKPIGGTVAHPHGGNLASGNQRNTKDPQFEFISSTSSATSSTPSQADRAVLSSQLPRSPSGNFDDSTHIPWHHLAGVPAAQSPVYNPGQTAYSKTASPNDDFEPAPISPTSFPPRSEHKRNKTTISDLPETLKPVGVDGQIQLSSSRNSVEIDSAKVEAPRYMFEFARNAYPAPQKPDDRFAQQFAIERRSTQSSDLKTQNIKDRYLVSSDHSAQPTSLSWQFPEARPQAGHQRRTSEDSIDSSSTVASDSWNPVEDCIASSSKDAPSISNATSLFNFGASSQSQQESGHPTDPAQLSWFGLRGTYVLGHVELAGRDHGVVVHDAAYVTGKIPETEEEWANVQLAPGYDSAPSPDGSVTAGFKLSELDGNELATDGATPAE
jgi:hypothetical protein